MHILVQVKVAAVAKALAAFAADIERLAGVGASVHAQLGSSGTALAAVLAAAAAVAAVGPLMPQQHRTVAEVLAILTARIRPVCSRF